ncbi:MAG: prolipoprotein diacylglyceryl transferase [Bacillota bacterium]|nr:prolipoprotein diacylglyceryl transferase [Bacillota bacterium]
MNPVAIDLGFIRIYWYGILVSSAMVTGYFIARHWAVRYGIDGDRFDGLVLVFVPVIIVGARIAFVIAAWEYFKDNPAKIIRIDHGGLGSHGAILAMLLCGYITSRVTKISFWTLADTFGPVLPAAHVFVRLGNFINGELYGLPTALPWGIVFPGTTEPHHPSMLYEGLAAIGLFALAWWWAAHRKREGEVFLKSLLVVSLVRLLVDFTRPRGEGIIAGLMLTQVLALLLAVLAGVTLLARSRRTEAI